jgi:hypothetical protein
MKDDSNKALFFCWNPIYKYNIIGDLKGRMVYELKFDSSGNSCFAETKKSDTETETKSLVPPPLVAPAAPGATTAPATITGIRTPAKGVNVKLYDKQVAGKPTKSVEIIVDIDPLCYNTDNCEIKNAHVKTGNVLEFTLEVTNAGAQPDACLTGAALISFSGTGVITDHSLICSKNMVGVSDFVEGKCMTCKEKTKAKDQWNSASNYEWQKSPESSCVSSEFCALSLLGKVINDNNVCKICNPCRDCKVGNPNAPVDPLGNYYGRWDPYAGPECSTCGGLPSITTTETP